MTNIQIIEDILCSCGHPAHGEHAVTCSYAEFLEDRRSELVVKSLQGMVLLTQRTCIRHAIEEFYCDCIHVPGKHTKICRYRKLRRSQFYLMVGVLLDRVARADRARAQADAQALRQHDCRDCGHFFMCGAFRAMTDMIREYGLIIPTNAAASLCVALADVCLEFTRQPQTKGTDDNYDHQG